MLRDECNSKTSYPGIYGEKERQLKKVVSIRPKTFTTLHTAKHKRLTNFYYIIFLELVNSKKSLQFEPWKLNKGLATSNSYRDGVEILSIVCGQMEKILHRTLSAEMLQKGDDMIRKYKDASKLLLGKLILNLK